MNLNRLIRLYLLLLFALLQCVAPLAHAHVNGHNADHNIHLASIAATGSGDHTADADHYAVEPEQSSVVCTQPVYRGSDKSTDQAFVTGVNPQFAVCEHSQLSIAAPAQQFQSSLPYQHPCSQAPPA